MTNFYSQLLSKEKVPRACNYYSGYTNKDIWVKKIKKEKHTTLKTEYQQKILFLITRISTATSQSKKGVSLHDKEAQIEQKYYYNYIVKCKGGTD